MSVTSDRNTQKLPYIVSSDVELLTQHWAPTASLIAPDHGFFVEQEAELVEQLTRFTNTSVEVVPSRHLIRGITAHIAKTAMQVVSMDRAYIDGEEGVDYFLDVTRAVDSRLEDLEDIVARPGFPSYEQQVEGFRTSQNTPICIVDDVLYSGKCMKDVIKRLATVNRQVKKVIVGIGIQDGIDEIEGMQGHNIEVACVDTYSAVLDEVCERDFVAGSPMSGRTLIADDGTVSAVPYFPRFGSAKWASITEENILEYARFGSRFSAQHWDEMERINGRRISGKEVPRPIRDLINSLSFASAIRESGN